MNAGHQGRLGARHLSQIQEESCTREHRSRVPEFKPLRGSLTPGGGLSHSIRQLGRDPTLVSCELFRPHDSSTYGLPPIVRRQPPGSAGQPGVEDTDKQEVTRPSDPLYEQQKKMKDNRSLLEELGRIEANLRESLRLDAERQREAEFLRQQENKLLRTNLCYLSLSQRITKPWVSSYFRKFPMHIYCLPVQAVGHRARRRGLTKRK